jgi:hypothetical protein
MARAYLPRVQNDYGDTLTFNLKEADGSASDLTGQTSLKVQVRREGYSGFVWSNPAAILLPATNGQITYTVQAADFTVPGIYYLQVEVKFATKEVTYDVAIVNVEPEIT